MAKVAQIGAGLVGKAMALDLAKQHNVFLTDFNDKALKEVQSLNQNIVCLLYTSPSPRDATLSRMPSSA